MLNPGRSRCIARFDDPLVRADGSIAGMLDLDSPRPNRFNEPDRVMLEALVRIYVANSDI